MKIKYPLKHYTKVSTKCLKHSQAQIPKTIINHESINIHPKVLFNLLHYTLEENAVTLDKKYLEFSLPLSEDDIQNIIDNELLGNTDVENLN